MTSSSVGGRFSRLPRVVERARLSEILQGAVNFRLTLITAPPGYGKTTVVAQYAERSPIPVIWHTLDASQRDVDNLHTRSIAAVGDLFPRVTAREAKRGIAPIELTASLHDFLRDEVRQDILYVFDDAHHLQSARAAETWLSTFVMNAPPNCHIILISRTIPDLPMAELIAKREIQRINQAALRFTPDEIETLATHLLGDAPLRVELPPLLERLEGWAAGLVLALQPAATDFIEDTLTDKVSVVSSSETLFDSLARTMIDTQPPQMRDFLLNSSITAKMQPEILNKVLQIPDSQRLLEEASHRNLFLMPVIGGVAYHGLFRTFLQQEFARRNANEFRRQHQRLAAWYEERYQIDDAVLHFLAAEAIEDAIRLMELVARPYYDQGKVETLLAWNAALTEQGKVSGWLWVVCATIWIERYAYDQAATTLDAAWAHFEALGETEGVARVALLDAHLDLQQGRFAPALAKAEQLLSQMTDLPNLRGATLRISGVAKMRLGQIEAAIRDFEVARPLYEQHSDRFAYSKLLDDLHIAYLQVGRVADASACLQQIVTIRRELGGQIALAHALNNLGSFQHMNGDYAAATETLEDGLRAAARARDRRIEGALHWTLGDLRRDLAAFDDAIQLYNRALECASSYEPQIRANVLISLSCVQRWQNKFDDAAQLAEEAAALADAHHLQLEHAHAHMALWVAKGMQGQFDSARVGLTDTIARLNALNTKSELAHAYVVLAAMAQMSKNRDLVHTALDAILRLVKDGALLQPVIAEIAYLPGLFNLVNNLSTKYTFLTQRVRQLRKAQIQPVNIVAFPEPDAPSKTYSLRVQTLGKQIVERDGVLVLSTEWQAARSREIFYYLLFMGGQQKEALTLEFWPDQDYQRVRQNLHSTISRGRAAIGDNVVVYRDDLYCINPDIDIWCDAHLFEKYIHDARGKPSRDVSTQELWRRALALYQGDFLPGFDSLWVIEERERLRELALEAMIGAGDCAQAQADFGGAVKHYQQALKLDEFREDVHRAILICYAARGERHKIKAHFESLHQLFLRELGCDVSEETARLVRNLLALGHGLGI